MVAEAPSSRRRQLSLDSNSLNVLSEWMKNHFGASKVELNQTSASGEVSVTLTVTGGAGPLVGLTETHLWTPALAVNLSLPEPAVLDLSITTEARAAPGLVLRRFDSPEPARRVALVRRRGAENAQWFDDLAQVLRAAGESLLATARADWGTGR